MYIYIYPECTVHNKLSCGISDAWWHDRKYADDSRRLYICQLEVVFAVGKHMTIYLMVPCIGGQFVSGFFFF